MFSSIPSDFFLGMTSLEIVCLDYIPFSAQPIPDSIQSASSLKVFSATLSNFTGKIPDYFGVARLTTLYLGYNNREGSLPANFSGSSIEQLWLSGQKSIYKLNGSIAVIQNMTKLTKLWLNSNNFSGTISPNFSSVLWSEVLILANNNLTGKDGVAQPPTISVPPSKTSTRSGNRFSIEVIVGLIIGGVFVVLLVGILIYCLYCCKQKHSSDFHVIEVGHLAISIHVLKSATNNFSKQNILGTGGFRTVYKGELHDGSKIAVKRMEAGLVNERVWDQFKSEIAVLSKAIDPVIDLNEETLASICIVADLAGHCCAKKPSQRTNICHAVNVLSSLVELRKPLSRHSEKGVGSSGELKLKDQSHTFQNELPQFFTSRKV
ncbi:Receptor protein kinase TMK1 [Camellia lanceoleosa]|uniref:Receptor protein kinase TMK1 n=1 Tax=Camellia lanceoleosa TaxID=1840588 RepID=A0ACC0G558_9ERIC|nr:Receptor protein kinase TMK1 [Camellia lanceoleosa]